MVFQSRGYAEPHVSWRFRNRVSTEPPHKNFQALRELSFLRSENKPDGIEEPRDGVRTLALPCATYVAFTGQSYHHIAYSALCSTALVPVGLSYLQALSFIPDDMRMSMLDELALLVDDARGPSCGTSAHEAIRDPLFLPLYATLQPLWELTHAALIAPNSRPDFRTYEERDTHGRRYYRADYVIGETLVADGLRIPAGHGTPIVEWNTALRLPAHTSDGIEPQHGAHFYFDDSSQEVALLIAARHHQGEPEPCPDLIALYRRSAPLPHSAIRLFDEPPNKAILRTSVRGVRTERQTLYEVIA